MKYIKLFILFFISIIIISFLSIRAYNMGIFDFGLKSKQDVSILSSQVIKDRIESANDLIVSKYFYTFAKPYKSHTDFNGWKVPFTEKSFIMKFDGVLLAGIDIDDIDVSIKDKKIVVSIPSATIIANDIDEKSVEILYEGQTIFNPIKADDFKKFIESQEDEVVEMATNKGFIEQSNKNSKLVIEKILKLDKLISNEYEVKIVVK